MAAINQKEYLKKYLSSGSESSKKKKRKKKGTGISDRVKIIDDDIDVDIFNKAVEDDLHGEDAPQIVGVIDDRPLELRIDDYRKSDLWTPVGTQNATASESARINETVSRNNDSSPPRRQKQKNVNSSEREEGKWSSSSDRSPPRRNESNRRSDFNPARRNAVIDDNSPPRRGTSDTDFSPPRRHSKSETQSPPGKNKKSDFEISDRTSKYDGKYDHSPLRRKRDDDLSPSRGRKNSDSSPSRRRRDGDSSLRRKRDYDPSPSRRRRRENDPSPSRRRRDNDPILSKRRRDNDLSPSRRRDTDSNSSAKRDIDSSPSRRRRSPVRSNEDSNNSFRYQRKNDEVSSDDRKRSYDRYSPRQYRKLSKDKSPIQRHASFSPPRKDSGSESRSKNMKVVKTLDGKAAGLQNADELARESEVFKKREDELFKNMSAEISGRNATAIVRDRRTGKIRDFKKEAEEESKRKEKEAENREKYTRWGKGLKQVEENDEKVSNELYEMSKPLARYADDEDLERYLKEQEREGDPMLDYIRKKKKKKQEIEQKPMKPQYEGEFMPNRYGIRPGYRWDGVDRSNDYEKKWFEVLNSRRANQEEVYKWSTEDM